MQGRLPRKSQIFFCFRSVVLALCVSVFLNLTATATRAQTIYALSGGKLIRFEANSPGVVTTIGTLKADIVGLDFRASDGQLYGYAAKLGVGKDAVYRINTTTAALTMVTQSAPSMATAVLGVDFDPVRDRLRVITDLGENHQVDPVSLTTLVDTRFSYVAGDEFAGGFPLLLDIGYAADGTLYGIDYLRDTLVRFEDPDAGTLRTIGKLGINTDRFTSFDIATVGGTTVAYASLGPSFDPRVANALFTVDLTTGAASRIGTFGASGVNGIAVAPTAVAAPEPAAFPLLLLGLVMLRPRLGSKRKTTISGTLVSH